MSNKIETHDSTCNRIAYCGCGLAFNTNEDFRAKTAKLKAELDTTRKSVVRLREGLGKTTIFLDLGVGYEIRELLSSTPDETEVWDKARLLEAEAKGREGAYSEAVAWFSKSINIDGLLDRLRIYAKDQQADKEKTK